MTARATRPFAVAAALSLLGCTGMVQNPNETGASGSPAVQQPGGVGGAGVGAGAMGVSGAGVVVTNPPPFQPPVGTLRRLTRSQFRNAVQDIFGVEADVSELEPDSWNGDFATIGATTAITSQTGVEQYQAAIEKAVASVFADATKRAALLGCTPSAQSNDTCTRGYLQNLGRRAWRRPLEAGELDRLMGVANTATTELGSAVEGAHWATVALFGSLSFLYRPELGAASTNGSLRLTGYELASRLAFLIWNSLPDKQLLDEAEGGSLATVDGLRAAAERLLQAPAGRQAVGEFAEQFMRLDRVETQAKDQALFPEYGAPLQAAMIRDMRGTWEAIALDDRSSVMDVFSTTKVVANAELAKLYGLDATGLTSTTFKTLELPADGSRIGILSKSGFLSQFANQKEGSPTLRGKFIRDSLMCRTIPPPPGNVTAMLVEPPADAPLTKRQRLELHRSDATCAGCHSLMDPIGLPLENFDAIGRFRTLDRGLMIDPSGDLDGTAVADAKALGKAMSQNADMADCLVRRYYSYALGHEERDVDGSVLNALNTSFQASGSKLRDLIVATITHDAFTAVAPQL